MMIERLLIRFPLFLSFHQSQLKPLTDVSAVLITDTYSSKLLQKKIIHNLMNVEKVKEKADNVTGRFLNKK
jgi:hypothetical protein